MEPGPWKREISALEERLQVALLDFGIAKERADAANFRDMWAEVEGRTMIVDHALTKWARNERMQAAKDFIYRQLGDLGVTARFTKQGSAFSERERASWASTFEAGTGNKKKAGDIREEEEEEEGGEPPTEEEPKA